MEKGRIEFDDPTFRKTAVAEIIGIRDAPLAQPSSPYFEAGHTAACTTIIDRLLELETVPPPLDMLIFCPACGIQHVDEAAPDVCEKCGIDVDAHDGAGCGDFTAWLNPPHKSHRCHYCNNVFRVADFPTNGVAEIKTRGKDDTWPEVGNG